MWQNMSNSDFNSTKQNFSSPGNQGDKKPPSQSNIIIPVTIRQILESSEDGLTIGGKELTKPLVRLVGIITAVDVSSMRIVYTLQDYTGSIPCFHWLHVEENETEVNSSVSENIYCSAFGSIRTTAEGKQLMLYKIDPIKNFNEINAHMLQVIQISLKTEDEVGQDNQSLIKQEMASSYGTPSASKSSNSYGLNAIQQRVLKAIKECPSEVGATAEYIASVLTTKLPLKEVTKIIEFLVNEGHAFTSVNDYTFQAT